MEDDNLDIGIDPDYITHNTALMQVDQIKEEKHDPLEKYYEVINKEFDTELSIRQNQIEDIEKQILKTQKLLHLIKYVLITSYYNRKELECNGGDDSNTKSDIPFLFDQNRMHPALKKLLGKDVQSLDLSLGRVKRKGSIEYKPNVMIQEVTSSYDNKKSSTSKENASNKDVLNGGNNRTNLSLEHNRQKVKNRIIVGNISKWMSSSEDDNLTHKWMMYVRGTKESPDVSHFIEKIVFYLHPSYKPFDVVEVSKPPFHLSRRGWGEFPIRVQIFFKCQLNKPVDIIHNLKLDKTYTGRQTLGNESVIDLYLYDNQIKASQTSLASSMSDDDSLVNIENKGVHDAKHGIIEFKEIYEMDHNTRVKEEFMDSLNLDIKEEQPDFEENEQPWSMEKNEYVDTSMCGQIKEENITIEDVVINAQDFEHNYCHEDLTSQLPYTELDAENVFEEHSYCAPTTDIMFSQTEPEVSKSATDEVNALAYGLDESYTQPDEDLNKKEPLFYKKSFVYTSKQRPVRDPCYNYIIKNGKIIAVKKKIPASPKEKPQRSVLGMSGVQLFDAQTAVKEIHRIDLPKGKFKNMGEVLPYLFRRVPLYSKAAQNPKYKSIYPFCVTTLSEYLAQPIATRTKCEWNRAEMIWLTTVKEEIHGYDAWNTKTILMYGRSHGYTPMSDYNLFEKGHTEQNVISSCFDNCSMVNMTSQFMYTFQNTSQEIDVENDSDESPVKKKSRLSLKNVADPNVDLQCTYIREQSLECGVVLKNEEIEKGIEFNGAERMILESVKCLISHLVRRSLHHRICSGEFIENIGEIQTNHVKKAINERHELSALEEFKSNQGLRYFLR